MIPVPAVQAALMASAMESFKLPGTASSAHKVVVTRDQSSAAALLQALAGHGYACLHYPVLRIRDADDGGRALRLAALKPWTWLVLTSANALTYLLRQVSVAEIGSRPIAVVGTATAAAVRDCGLSVTMVASAGDAMSLLSDLGSCLSPTDCVLLPQAANARPLLSDGLAALGVDVVAPIAYVSEDAVPATPLPLVEVGAVTFASSATVSRFLAAIGEDATRTLIDQGCRWVAIGRHSAARCVANGLQPLTVAHEASIDGMVDAVARAFLRS